MWEVLCEKGFLFHKHVTSVNAELLACENAVRDVCLLLQEGPQRQFYSRFKSMPYQGSDKGAFSTWDLL